jgi:uncharacterized protein with NAD-binding domain and iron-sulfur cluster
MAKQRIAILGGGIAALTAAFEITDDPNWQNDYEVTVYQLGWRLGGKCASGRNAAHFDRIEEHGLHIYLGFYDNAFRVIKKCYAEMGRPAGAPLATWDEAFKKQSYIVLTEQLRSGKYVPWALDFPTTSEEPGTGGVLPSPWAAIEMLLGWLRQLIAGVPRHADRAGEWQLEAAHHASKARDDLELMRLLLEGHRLLDRIDQAELELDLDLRRLFVSVDLAMAGIKGMIENHLIFPPYDFFKLDSIDFRDWLSKYGARSISVHSAYINGVYDLAFTRQGEAGAGTALNGVLRMVFTYKGAVMWKMQAGMGETIIVPLYEVLRKRGVTFEFFQRVDSLELSEDKSRIARVVIGQQATLKNPAAGYEPLVVVKDLPCWPSEPRYDQLEQGEALRASGENLEDWWTAWSDPVPPRVLEDGKDFDRVILGASVAIFPYIARELIDASPPFGAMVEALGTRATQAVQLWMNKDLQGLGWTLPSPVLDGYVEPLDTWADMTHLVPRESWPPASVPQNLAYLVGGLDDVEPLPPRSDHGYVERQDARVRANAEKWLDSAAAGLWPDAVAPDRSFDWPLLVAPGSTIRGPTRLDTQYWISVLNPSDRYVLSLPNTVDKRLRTDGAGFANLLLAGDWLLTGISAGSVEAATMAGMHASREICGRPKEITGDPT